MKKIILLIALFLIASHNIYAQDSSVVKLQEQVDELKGALEGLNESYLETKNTVGSLSKLKISGYIQSQYQVGESDAGFSSFSGGSFSEGVRDRFMIRRGRVKFTYTATKLTSYVLQFDVTEKGLGIKDAYVTAKEPWLNLAELKVGAFDRPFGYEISYSSSMREAPERTRMSQILFPGERDLGAQIALTPEEGLLSNFNLKAGVFNGNKNSAVETDGNKDFIGRLGYSFPFQDEGFSIDGGFSLYAGKVTTDTTILKFDESANNWVTDKAAKKDQTENRTYFGADMQLYYDIPVLGGAILRGDFITGDQPSTKDSDEYYPTGSTSPIYNRNFVAWAITYVQNIGDNLQFVARYDEFDPNTKVKGSDFKAGSNLTKGDIKYSTFGLGAIYHWDANLKFVLYYDMVTNEEVDKTSSLTAYQKDINDNVLTIRAQYKF